MFRRISLGLVLTAIATVYPALAAPMSYECDTPADRFSNITIPVDSSGFKMSGTMQADSFQKGRFLPVANVSLADKEGNKIWLRLVAGNAKQKFTDIIVETTKAKKALMKKVGTLPIGEPLNFSIETLSSGKIRITANLLSVEVSSEVNGDSALSISCSTGEFNFSNLEWSEK